MRAVLPIVAMLAGCAQFGMVDDGSTLAFGPGTGGWLENARKLPPRGDGYWVPPRWSARGNQYGTDELVGMVVRVGRRLQRETVGPPMGVADLAAPIGGKTRWHRSHQTGLDVDLLFFMLDDRGVPVTPHEMWHVADDGVATVGGYRFDVARNWALVRALLEEPTVEVQYVFVYDPLKQMLLDHARAAGEPTDLIDRAEYLLQQPGDAAPHDDHFHVRVYCPEDDRALGCDDRGSLRWSKKLYKYGQLARTVARLPEALHARIAGPRSIFGLGLVPVSHRPTRGF